MGGRSDPGRSPAGIMRCLAVVALCLLSGPGQAWAEAAPPGSPLQGEDRVRAIQWLQEQQREVATVRASVVQRKRHPLLQAEVVSQGTLLFQRPNRMRWDLEKPEPITILVDGYTLLTYRPARQEAERRDLREDVGTRAALEFLSSGMRLAVAELEQRFQVDLYREDGGLVLLLTPRSRWIARAVASVVITQHAADAVPRRIVIVGRKGERTETTLTHVTINHPFPEEAFTLRLGPGVRVTDLRRPAGESDSGR